MICNSFLFFNVLFKKITKEAKRYNGEKGVSSTSPTIKSALPSHINGGGYVSNEPIFGQPTKPHHRESAGQTACLTVAMLSA